MIIISIYHAQEGVDKSRSTFAEIDYFLIADHMLSIYFQTCPPRSTSFQVQHL